MQAALAALTPPADPSAGRDRRKPVDATGDLGFQVGRRCAADSLDDECSMGVRVAVSRRPTSDVEHAVMVERDLLANQRFAVENPRDRLGRGDLKMNRRKAIRTVTRARRYLHNV
jgi:hypothetical protein